MPAVKTAIKKAAAIPVKKTASKKTAKTVAFESRWAVIEKGFVELQKSQQEFQKDMQKGMQELRELHAETEKAHAETEKAHAETERALKKSAERLDRDMGRLGNKLGDIAEHTLIPDLPRKFKSYNFTFGKISRNIEFDEQGIAAQIDAMLENGGQAMAVEVKATLRRDDVDDHIERMEKIRAHANLHGDKRQFFGALAAMVVDADTRIYARKQGFFVVEPSGEDVIITKPSGEPRAW